ncbi:MAG: hypothetical protein ACI8UD_002430 [Planctomycetota bacterium]|jgi:hypothetical protein
MPKCDQCGDEHELLDPMFQRPDAYVTLEEDQREEHARADDDLCRIDLPTEAARMFVRCVLPVKVQGLTSGISWVLWGEIEDAAFARILELWNDDEQANEPPIAITIANSIPGHQTLGLEAHIQLTSPSTRPNLVLTADTDNEFTKQCLEGVALHQAHLWHQQMAGVQSDNPLDKPDLRAFVCGHVAAGDAVLYAVRDGDGDWQFLCGGEHGGATDQPSVLTVGELIERDASLREVGTRLKSGQQAERADAQSPWRF